MIGRVAYSNGTRAPREPVVVRRDRLLLWMGRGLLVVAALHVVVVTVLAPKLPEDDAYITFRHAENFARGLGLVFTPGERVLGTTTPLFAAALAPVRLIVGHDAFPASAILMCSVWLVATALLLLALLRELGLPAPLRHLASAWLLLLPQSIAVTLGGMEPFFFHALALAAFLLAARGRWPAAGLLASLTVLARPEGVLVLAALALAWLLASRPRPLATLSLTALPGVLWILVAGLYFGSPISASVVAKAAVRGTVPRWDAARHLAAEMGRWLFGGQVGIGLQVAVAVGSLLLVVAAGFGITRARPVAVALLAWSGLHALFYIVGNPAWYPWYGALLLVPWWCAVVLGFDAFAQRAGLRWVATTLLGAMVLAQVMGAAFALARPGWPGTAYEVLTPYRLRILAYEQAARFVNQQGAADAQVLSSEIGMLGWTLERARVLDSLGLVSPQALPYLPAMVQSGELLGTVSAEMALALRPTFVVTFPMFAHSLENDPEFARHFELRAVFTVPGRDYPNYRLSVFAARTAQ